MGPAFTRGATLSAALTIIVIAQESNPSARAQLPVSPVPTASRTPIGPPPTPTLVPQFPTPTGEAESEQPKILSRAAPHPLLAGDCANGAWQQFTAPTFTDQGACESWVHEFLSPGAGPHTFAYPQPDPLLHGMNRRSSIPLRA
jgi:hypothetical protein